MPDTILGLPTSAKFQAESDRFNAHRRRILDFYPTGGCPLTGILSRIPTEPVNDSILYWYERRYASPGAALRGTDPVTSTAPSTGDANDGTAATTGAKAITAVWYFKVDSTKDFKVGHVFNIDTQSDLLFWVTAVTRGVSAEATNGYLTAVLVRAATFGTIATIFAASTRINIVGSSYGEGQTGTGLKATAFKRPYRIENTTQIFRDQFEFPGSVLQMGLKYDKSGPYRIKAKDTVVDHMTSIERALIWGRRATTTRSSFDSSQETLSVRNMSGIIEFLELWDAGSTGLSVDGATYAPYGFKAANVSDTDDQKRVITNTAGTFTVKMWNEWCERVGRYSTNKTSEKLVICGSGALIALTDMFRKNSCFTVSVGETVYGLGFTILKTPFGNFNFITHPLFNENSTYRYWCLILDIWSLNLRPLLNRDTRLLKNRQNNGDDLRRDEYLTELSLELHAPERHMLIKNIRSYTEV